MSAVDDIASHLPIDQIAQQIGEDPAVVEQAVHAVLPALLGGLAANAQDPAGEASLARALGQHDDDLATGPVDLSQVDVQDGQRIAAHIFGAQQEQVVSQLGSLGGSGSLVSKLLPLLAPIVLSYLAKQAGGAGGSTGGGVLSTILQQILTGAAQGTSTGSSTGGSSGGSTGVGSILEDVLGGLLGGGRR